MICKNPFPHGGSVFPCGNCLPCRINRRRMWSHRIMLESLLHGDNAFVTLTYEDEKLPVTKDGVPTLVPEHVQNWLKRLRKAYEPQKLRFYLVGEYGDKTERPHYHVILFGYPSCLKGISQYSSVQTKCCSVCDGVRKTWGFGHVSLGRVEMSSASYVAGYVMKKMTRFDDPRLNGRYPEFCRMSLRPGIGAFVMDDVASEMMRLKLDTASRDVPLSLRHGTKMMPLGRYLRRRLRERIGRDAKAPLDVKRAAEMSLLRERQMAHASRSIVDQILEESKGKIASLEAREKLRKGRTL